MSNHLHIHNVEHSEAFKNICEAINLSHTQDSVVRTKSIYVERNSEWVPMLVVSILIEKNERQKDISRTYHEVRYIETYTEPNNYLSKLENRLIILGGHELQLPENLKWEKMRLPGNNNYSINPGDRFSTDCIKERSYHQHEVLIDYNEPYYTDLSDAINEWLGQDGFTYNDAREGKYFLFISDNRVRFSNLNINDGKLIARIETVNKKRFKLKIKGYIKWNDDFVRIDQDISDEISIKLPNNIEEIDIYLIDSNNIIHDYHIEGSYYIEGKRRLLGKEESKTNEKVDDLLNQGESNKLEFKPYIDPDNNKMAEVVRTVIAFSNTYGGHILIGVADDCSVIGIEKQLHKKYRDVSPSTLDEKVKKYIGDVRQKIGARIDPSISISIESAVKLNHTLLHINVMEGKKKPYQEQDTNKIYVRRGANNRLIDRNELKEIFNHQPKVLY